MYKMELLTEGMLCKGALTFFKNGRY